MPTDVKLTVKNINGGKGMMNLFKYFDDGLRKRLPKLVAADFKETLLDNIDSNKFGFQLSKGWQDYKRRVGADSRPFLMFGYYKNAITIVTEQGHITVGFKKSAKHPRAMVPMGELARSLEDGDLSMGVPSRPLWKRTIDQYVRERKQRVGMIIKKSIKNK